MAANGAEIFLFPKLARTLQYFLQLPQRQARRPRFKEATAMTSNFTRNVTAAICAVLFGATMVFGAIGPVVIHQTPEVSGNPA